MTFVVGVKCVIVPLGVDALKAAGLTRQAWLVSFLSTLASTYMFISDCHSMFSYLTNENYCNGFEQEAVTMSLEEEIDEPAGNHLQSQQ